MKFKVKQEELLTALAAAIKVVPEKPTNDALQHFLLHLKGQKMKITASDTETSLCIVLSAQNVDNGEGKFLVGAKVLHESLREIPQGDVELTWEQEKKRLIIDWGTGRSALPALEADAFPVPEKFQMKTSFSTQAKTLAEALTQTVFATANDDLRPALGGVLFDMNEDGVTLAASNSHILSTAQIQETKAVPAGKYIIHRKPLSILTTLLNKVQNAVQMEFNERNARILIGNCLMTMRLVDSRFPAYQSIFPAEKDIKSEISVGRDDLMGTIRRMSVYKTKEATSLKMKMEKGQVVISTNGESKAKAHEQVKCLYQGDDLSIIFNIDSLSNIVSRMPYEKIKLLIQDAKRAVILTEDDTEGKSEGGPTKMLIMPLVA